MYFFWGQEGRELDLRNNRGEKFLKIVLAIVPEI